MNKYILQVKTIRTSRQTVFAENIKDAKKTAEWEHEQNIVKTQMCDAEILKETKTYEVIK